MQRNLKPSAAEWLKCDKPEHIVGFLLKSVHHTLRQRIDEALRERGLELSFAHFATLFGLFMEPGSTGAQLARRAMVSAQTMSSILRRLETDHLIERQPHPQSRRADSWSLTDAGIGKLDGARAIGDTVFSRMLSALDAKETAALQDYLRRCIAALEGGSSNARSATPESDSRATRSVDRRVNRRAGTGATADASGEPLPSVSVK